MRIRRRFLFCVCVLATAVLAVLLAHQARPAFASSFRNRHAEGTGHYLGNGLRFVGDVRGSGDLVCESEVQGMIELDGVVRIGPRGKVRGGIKAKEADIAGSVEGDVVARGRVTLRTSGNLKGDVTTGELVVEPGAVLQGQLQIETEQSEPSLGPPKPPSSTVLSE